MGRIIDDIVIHEADCALLKPSGAEFTQADIDQWHRERGFKRSDSWRQQFNPELSAIGYHYVIGVHGDVWTGRHLDEIPAAVQGHNHDTINICLIGKGRYTTAQWQALALLVIDLRGQYPNVSVKGHYQYDTAIAQGKTCPDFDVPAWYSGGMSPPEDHVEEVP